MDFELLIKEAQNVLPGLREGEYVTVFRTAKGNMYTETAAFLRADAPYALLDRLAGLQDTHITALLCAYGPAGAPRLERPSAVNCRALAALHPENRNAVVAVQGENGILLRRIAAFL